VVWVWLHWVQDLECWWDYSYRTKPCLKIYYTVGFFILKRFRHDLPHCSGCEVVSLVEKIYIYMKGKACEIPWTLLSFEIKAVVATILKV
jgi:hypothetical protein